MNNHKAKYLTAGTIISYLLIILPSKDFNILNGFYLVLAWLAAFLQFQWIALIVSVIMTAGMGLLVYSLMSSMRTRIMFRIAGLLLMYAPVLYAHISDKFSFAYEQPWYPLTEIVFLVLAVFTVRNVLGELGHNRA